MTVRHLLRASSAIALAAAVVSVFAAAPAAAAVPDGFRDLLIASPASNPLSQPTAIAPLGDGRALVLEKAGAVRVLQADGTLAAADALQLSVCTASEQGLLGAVPDPGFATNGFVYLYYSRNAGNCASSSGRFNRVSRLTMTGDTIDPASERVLLDNLAIPAGNHDGGDLHIGADGDLYVSVGDGGTNPRGQPGSAAQDLSLLNGKILRINLDGSSPTDNPLVGQAGAQSCATTGLSTATSARCTEIYAWGLRNPFRFAFDPNGANTTFFVNDVGEQTWEEVDLGIRGANYGWSEREGFCVTGSSTNCGSTPAQYTDPLTAYNHSSGCTYITAGAFVPNGLWPTQYDGSYLFADGGCGKIWQRSATGAVDYGAPFATTSGVIADMAFVTQGGETSLFYVTNGSSELHRIWYDHGGRSRNFRVNTGLPDTNVVLQLTTDNYEGGNGWTAAYDCDEGYHGTSSTNNANNPIASNLVIVPTDANGDVCVTAYQRTDLVVDLAGSLPGATIGSPTRVLDTRLQGPRLAAGQDRRVHVGPADAVVAVQVTTDNFTGGTGWTAVFACAAGYAGTSSLNNKADPVASNLVIAPTDANGDVCVRAQSDTDLIVDVAGTLDRADVHGPQRVLDTRVPGSSTVASSRQVHVGPANAVVVLQVTTDDYVTGTGWTAVFSCAAGSAGTSSLNNTANPIASNLVIVPTDAGGNVCVSSYQPTDLIVDLAGTLGNAQIHSPTRIFDSRVS
jgi:glucose/arabinose dehydrogenase